MCVYSFNFQLALFQTKLTALRRFKKKLLNVIIRFGEHDKEYAGKVSFLCTSSTEQNCKIIPKVHSLFKQIVLPHIYTTAKVNKSTDERRNTWVMKHTHTLQSFMSECSPCQQLLCHQNHYLEGIAKTFACVRRTVWFTQVGNVPDSTSIMDLEQKQSDFTVTGLNNQPILPLSYHNALILEGVWTKTV